MKCKLFRLVVVFYLLLTIISCKDEQEDIKFEKPCFFLNALEEGDFFVTKNNIAFLIHKDSLYFIAASEKGFTQDSFLLNFIKDDGSFFNADIVIAKNKFNKIFVDEYPKLNIFITPIDLSDYSGIRVVQYKRDINHKPINVWSEQIFTKSLAKGNNRYTNELDEFLEINFLNTMFKKDLKDGVFFENPFGFYVLLTKTNVYLITAKDKNLLSPIMLHLVKQDNTFENLSFKFNSKEIQTFLETPFDEWRIAKIQLPEVPYFKIRFGQYTSNGNLWAQEIWPNELWSNPLLKYNKELGKGLSNKSIK